MRKIESRLKLDKLLMLLRLPIFVAVHLLVAVAQVVISPYMGVKTWASRYAWDWGFKRDK